MIVYRFVDAERAGFPVATMCRVLGVSPSGYWAWASRPPSARARANAALTTRIGEIHAASRGTYGAPGCRPSCASVTTSGSAATGSPG